MISHQYKLIFIHVPKCGGTSIENALGHFEEPFLHAQDHRSVRELEPLNLHLFFDSEGRNALRRRIRHARKRKFPNPNNALTVTRDQWNSYFKFAVVRNPWSRVYSIYRATMRSNARKQRYGISDDLSFPEFIERYVPWSNISRPQTKWICNSRGHIALDKIIRFADINTEYTNIANDFDLPVKTLPRHLAAPPASYVEAYDSALREKVGRIYQDEIRLLNFKFEDEI